MGLVLLLLPLARWQELAWCLGTRVTYLAPPSSLFPHVIFYILIAVFRWLNDNMMAIQWV